MIVELTNEQADIDFGAKGLDEIAQNVRMILNTRAGSLPLDRDFGIDWSIIDAPTTRAFAWLKKEVVEKIEKYEPRVKVQSVTVFKDKEIVDGIFKVNLTLKILSL